MKLSYQIAKRYLFGKKTTNAINYITAISVLGIAIGSAALILILSVFNGFEELTRQNLDAFNPDIKIEPILGKHFSWDEEFDNSLSEIADIEKYSKVIEEVAHFEYRSRQQIGVIKGVDSEYLNVTSLSESISAGKALIKDDNQQTYSIVGNGLYYALNISLGSQFETLKISVPNRKKRGVLDKDFKSRSTLVSGVFFVRSEKDNQYVVTDYNLVASILNLRNSISALEIKLNSEADITKVRTSLSKIFAEEQFSIKDRMQQDASILKVMNIEKWSSYLIFTFTLLLIVFNIIGCLWMIVLEKKKDISVLQSFGATKRLIKNIFLIEGALISIIGFGIGLFCSVTFYVLQKTVGIITVPTGFDLTSYPMEMEVMDILVILVTVLFLGIGASIPASIRASRVSAYVRTE